MPKRTSTPPTSVGPLPFVGPRDIAKVLRTAMPEAPSDRHLEVLRAALSLMAERGYAGASLRALAAKVGVQQPSLYHWFDSKEQLAEQIVTHLGPTLFVPALVGDLPDDLLEMPRFLVEATIQIWSQPDYVSFVRLVLALSTELPRFRNAARLLYGQAVERGVPAVFHGFLERGEIDLEEAMTLTRTAVNGIGLMMIEERAIEGRADPSPEARAYAVALARQLEDALRFRRSGRRVTAAR